MNRIFYVLGAGALVYYLLKARTTLSLTNDNIFVRGVTFKDNKFQLILEFLNPTNRDLKVNFGNLKFYNSADNVIGYSIIKPFTLQRTNTTQVYIPLSFTSYQIADAITNAYQTKSLTITVKGSVNVEGVNLPINYKVNLL